MEIGIASRTGGQAGHNAYAQADLDELEQGLRAAHRNGYLGLEIVAVEDPVETFTNGGAFFVQHQGFSSQFRQGQVWCGKSSRVCDLPEMMTKTILKSVNAAEVDPIGVICPSCFDSFDTGQIRIALKFNLGFTIPPVYFFQLLALAQGLEPAEVGLDKHKLKPNRLLEVISTVRMVQLINRYYFVMRVEPAGY